MIRAKTGLEYLPKTGKLIRRAPATTSHAGDRVRGTIRPMQKGPRLYPAAMVIALLLWLRLIFGLVSNPPPMNRFVFFDDKGQRVDEICARAIVVDGSRLWTVCGLGTYRIGRLDVETGRADLSAPIDRNGSFAGFMRVGDDTYVVTNLDPHVYRVAKDGRVDDLGAVGDAPAVGIGWVNDHVEVVTGRVLPAIHAREGTAWKSRPIHYRDDDYEGRALEVAYREAGAWKLVVTRVPKLSPPNVPVKVDVEIGDESGHWQTTQQLELDEPYVLRLSNGTVSTSLGPTLDGSAGGFLQYSSRRELPLPFTNGRAEPLKPPVGDLLWDSDGSYENGRLTSVPHASYPSAIVRIRGQWIAIERDRGAVLKELATGKRSPRALAPYDRDLSLVPYGGGYLLFASDGGYARADNELRRTDSPNVFARLRLLDAAWWEKLILAVLCLAPIGMYLRRRHPSVEPIALAYILAVIGGMIWVLPMLRRI
jgi:hypothetical protein